MSTYPSCQRTSCYASRQTGRKEKEKRTVQPRTPPLKNRYFFHPLRIIAPSIQLCRNRGCALIFSGLRILVCFDSSNHKGQGNPLLVEQWERDRKAASLPKRALHLDRPAVLFDNAQGNREARSHPWLDGSVWGSVKALKTERLRQYRRGRRTFRSPPQRSVSIPSGLLADRLLMPDFRTRKGKKLRATDAAQGLFFLLPYPMSGCSNLKSTLIGDMHKTIAITVQQITRTHAHP
jgi:hypothetical protein